MKTTFNVLSKIALGFILVMVPIIIIALVVYLLSPLFGPSTLGLVILSLPVLLLLYTLGDLVRQDIWQR